jgi:archaeosortase C (PEF-CTERM variant)
MSEAAKAKAARELVMRLARGEEQRTLAERFIERLTLGGRLTPFLPVIGVAIIAADLAWNLLLTGSTVFLTYDWLALLTGAFLVVYNFVPEDYERERAFAFVFLLALALMLIAPVLVERAGEGNAASQEGISAYSEYLLVKPLDGMLRLSGIWSTTDGVFIRFETTYVTSDGDNQMNVLIATSCSGVYSFAIFVAAFIAFVATEFKRWDSRLKWFLALGILAAYVANLLRMYIIVLMGHFYSEEAFRDTHANAGWLIYMAWIALFWWLLFRWFFKQQEGEVEARGRGQAAG